MFLVPNIGHSSLHSEHPQRCVNCSGVYYVKDCEPPNKTKNAQISKV